MSSFIVSKKEFVKAAGLMYGIAENNRCKPVYFLSHVYETFVELYELNAQSVDEQYNEVTEHDENAYLEIFEEYKRKGSICAVERGINRKKYTKMVAGLKKFFDSVLYQTESEIAHKEMCNYFYDCIQRMQLFEGVDTDDWWGEVAM